MLAFFQSKHIHPVNEIIICLPHLFKMQFSARVTTSIVSNLPFTKGIYRAGKNAMQHEMQHKIEKPLKNQGF